MKRAVIFLHGDKPQEGIKKYIKKSDTIVCADGGTIWAVAYGLMPDIIIGDFDSITPSLKKSLEKEKIEWHTFPKDKDLTDSELALEYVIKKGYRDILIIGAFGSRIDHMMANFGMFAEAEREGAKIMIVIDKQEIRFIHDQIDLDGQIGEFVSLIPVKGDVTGVTTQGLKWRLYNATLFFGKTIGISNEFISKKVRITLDKGIVMVAHTRH